MKKTKANKKPAKNSIHSVKLHDEHIAVIIKALEVYYRLRSGQINMALDTAYSNPLPWYFFQAIETLIRSHTHPELTASASYGFNGEKMGDAKIAYEINKTLQEFLSVKNNDGFYGSGANFHGPLKASEIPFPEIEGFIKYKDYPLPDPQTNKKAYELLITKKYEELWDLVDSLNLDLPKGEKKELLPVEIGVIIRVWKPYKKDENGW